MIAAEVLDSRYVSRSPGIQGRVPFTSFVLFVRLLVTVILEREVSAVARNTDSCILILSQGTLNLGVDNVKIPEAENG